MTVKRMLKLRLILILTPVGVNGEEITELIDYLGLGLSFDVINSFVGICSVPEINTLSNKDDPSEETS